MKNEGQSTTNSKTLSSDEETGLIETNRLKTLDDFLVLKDFGLTIKQGEFVCIIGDVGSGKSSMLSALIGDMIHADA